MRFLHDHLIALCSVVALAIAAVFWFQTPQPTLPAPRPLAKETWKLPEPQERDAKKWLEQVNARNLWGVPASATVAVKEPEWKVLGIANIGADSFVLMAFDGKPQEILKTGDLLPDGAKIVQIEKDRFMVLTPEKKKMAFGIYKNAPPKQ